jgi:hypothetical protein
LFAYGVYAGEVVAPLFVIAGFYSRIDAALIGINMLFAIGLVHGAEFFIRNETGGWALELQAALIGSTTSRRGLTMDLQQAMKNPNVVFDSPEMIEASMEFTALQKRAILTQWKDQLEKLLIADEESMLRADAKAGANADCLRRVTNILTRLPA